MWCDEYEYWNVYISGIVQAYVLYMYMFILLCAQCCGQVLLWLDVRPERSKVNDKIFGNTLRVTAYKIRQTSEFFIVESLLNGAAFFFSFYLE